MNLTVLLLDNNVYGLTKNQTSPTTRLGEHTNTHPQGSVIEPLNPLSVALGIGNVSFVAQTVDWNPSHVYNTLRAAHEHRGTSLVRVLQRCPHFTAHVFEEPFEDPTKILLLEHNLGVALDAAQLKRFPNRHSHDPASLDGARAVAARRDVYPIGLLYRNGNARCYDDFTNRGLSMTQAAKLDAIRSALNGFSIQATNA